MVYDAERNKISVFVSLKRIDTMLAQCPGLTLKQTILPSKSPNGNQ